ncbi:MAG: damage-inducible protein CinA [Candidatus Dactylopiibacterium carminicum]|uniref:CinA family protein n=1 Tax=Candidatus Dactylopiibacterium carminicum TaxID=857335 RepID=A0A272EYW0_9RHOO|nr:CinA family protein [Candidatus Dactylopiibacterium carminicum]KAF7600800.1 CinA family protein [Candidatus Dactylopiibacterium carminicum]PAS95299.1 MAG: damage-inducible protein CinA [Candidatus Dactylopiibacterium carminicum]PAS98689.1 MAG: damage-inducible protein CinA [Candidatus Dactylopiibacterium carminicum]PAT00807.1 MAG: damage-inducible protein CinA [Candidatus Dactylopiibacterium carminicum]
MTPDLISLATRVGEALMSRHWQLGTAESCTGGLVSALVTEVAGSSAWFDRGIVSYSNEAKVELLGVSPLTLHAHGAVSEQTVREMLSGVLARSSAQVAVAVSGIAGPGGGTAEKPVGTVCFGWQRRGVEAVCETLLLPGSRAEVRRAAAQIALAGVLRHALD